jgi:type 1 fimbriae regulatory protein FimE
MTRVATKVVDIRQPSFSGKLPKKPRNKDVQSREYLTGGEVNLLMNTASRVGRHGHRDKTFVLLAYRHGLRVSELVALRWDQIDLKAGQLHVNRLKDGIDSTHPLRGIEIRALRRLQREYGKRTLAYF